MYAPNKMDHSRISSVTENSVPKKYNGSNYIHYTQSPYFQADGGDSDAVDEFKSISAAKGTGERLHGVIVPKSWPLMPHFQAQIKEIKDSLIDDADWFTMPQIKSLKNNVKGLNITVTLSKEFWITECKKSFQNVNLPLIPVVINKGNNYWIEWIKIVSIESQNIFVGISFKYDEGNNKWNIHSIYLDGLKRAKYGNKSISATQIIFSDNKTDNIDNIYDNIYDVIKIYDILQFEMNPIGTDSNIYIDYMTAIQMLQGFSKDFINTLCSKRRVVIWNQVKLFKSQSTHNNAINKSVTITQNVMNEYFFIALERLNNNNNNFVPILEKDGIEWILIVNLVHKECDVGVAFRYDDKSNVFIVTAIYLNKGEIESKHKLIGLRVNYCRHLRPFSLKEFKFRSDDDDQHYQAKQHELIRYKKALEHEKLKNRDLQQSLQKTDEMMNDLKEQHDDEQNEQYMIPNTIHININIDKKK